MRTEQLYLSTEPGGTLPCFILDGSIDDIDGCTLSLSGIGIVEWDDIIQRLRATQPDLTVGKVTIERVTGKPLAAFIAMGGSRCNSLTPWGLRGFRCMTLAPVRAFACTIALAYRILSEKRLTTQSKCATY